MTFNPDAIPFAAIVLLFGALQFTYRERLWSALQKRRWDDPRKSRTAFRDWYCALLAVWCLVVAIFSLFYKFD